MNNLENSGESLLRDKLLQHEFAADEQAWEKMDELLKNQALSTPTPTAAPSGLTWIMGGKWLLGLLVIGLVGWWMMPSEQSVGTDAVSSSASNEKTSKITRGNQQLPLESSSYSDIDKNRLKSIRKNSIEGKINNSTRRATGNKHNKSIYVNNPVSKTGNSLPKNHRDTENSKSDLHLPVPDDIVSSNILSNSSANNSDSNTLKTDSITSQQSLLTDSNKQLFSPLSTLPQRTPVLPSSQWHPRSTVPMWASPYQGGPRLQIGIIAGGQLAYIPQDPYQVFMASPTGGISVNYQMWSRWSIQADAQYRNVPFNIQAYFAQSRLDANGQFQAWVYVTSSRDLEFFEVSLLAKRKLLNNSGHLFIGLRPAYIRPTGLYSHTFSNGISFPFSPPIEKGIRNFDLAFTLGADLRLGRKLWLDMRVNQGFLDLTHDDFFQNNNTDVTTDLNLSLRYYFFHF